VWRMFGLVLCWTNEDPGGEGVNFFLETIGCTIIPFAGYYNVWRLSTSRLTVA
jgi:hypothetical protein